MFNVSESVVLSASSSSLSPCAILAVHAIVSRRKVGPSRKPCQSFPLHPDPTEMPLLLDLFVLAGTILKAPLDNVTACLKNAYCAEDTFLELPSSSPSEMLDILSVSSAWIAARKSNGESSRLSGYLDECEDLEHDELSEPSKL